MVGYLLHDKLDFINIPGNYIIVVALMNEIKSSPDTLPVLGDYVHPVAAIIMPGDPNLLLFFLLIVFFLRNLI